MKSHVQAAVIGGGVVGASVLYHLTKLGWKDVALIERAELTSGSTWHAAGGMHTFNSDPNVAKLQHYTIQLYQEIEEISGQSCGVHLTGGIMLADSPDRLDYLRVAAARGKYLGLETAFISPEEAARQLPIMDPRHYVGALYDPNEGHVDPSGVTNAYARAARLAGAKVYRHTRVVELVSAPDGGWNVVTDQGTIHAQHVVNAAGLWGREVGRMVGIELPFLPMEHQYLITEAIPALEAIAGGFHVIDFGGEIYMRGEGKGALLGTYERVGKPWSERATPWDFPQELLPPDLDRISENLERAFERFPVIGEAGIKNVINGPFTFTPDGNPLVGPVRGLSNYWVACGVLAGFSQGGGIGLALSSWMVEGDPGMDVWAMDVARFGSYASPAYANAKGRETYSRRFFIPFPNEELPAARPLRTTPVYSLLKAEGGVFGAAFGLEQALWFAPRGSDATERPTYRRSNAFDAVDAECHAVRERVGMIEISGFAKYEVRGPAAELWLDSLLANHMPPEGRMLLAPMLNPNGKLIGDFTVAKLGHERFLIFGSGIAEQYHLRWFEQHLPESGVAVTSLCSELTGFSIAGPQARDLLSRVTDEDVSNDAFRFMAIRRLHVGMVPCLVARISFTGDLGYEIWCSPDYQVALYRTLRDAAEGFEMRLFGSRALNALRLEKAFGSFRREYTPDYSPLEAGLAQFVDLNKSGFVGRDALMQERARGSRLARVSLVVDSDGADAFANEPIYHRGKVVGWVTSGGFAHYVDKSIALGYVPNDLADELSFELEILGQRRGAERAQEPLFDPTGRRMRQ